MKINFKCTHDVRLISARARLRKHGNVTVLCPYVGMVLEKKGLYDFNEAR